MELDVDLRFRTTGKDVIGYLVAADAPDDGGLDVRNEDDFQKALDALDGTRRERRILITDTRDHAESLALLRRCEGEEEMMITRLADHVHALSIIGERTDDWYGGVPLISDLRKDQSLELATNFDESPETDIWEIRPEVYYQNLNLIEIDQSPSPDM